MLMGTPVVISHQTGIRAPPRAASYVTDLVAIDAVCDDPRQRV